MIIISIEYKNGVYKGKLEAELALDEEDWYIDRSRYESRFYNNLSERLKKIRINKPILVRTPEQFAEIEDLYNYGIIVDIKSVDGKGNVYAHVTLINKKSNIKETKLINAEGGTFGTWLNLFGDGMASLGVQIVNFIAKTDAF